MRKIILTLTILIGLFSCFDNQNNQDSPNLLTLEIGKLSDIQSVNVSALFQKFKFVSLESKEKDLLGIVSKVVFFDEKLYIKSGSGLFVFSKDGKFLFSIKNKGEGPSEYKSISDFVVNENIEILDHIGRKVLSYDKNGKFLSSWITPFMATNFAKITDDKYIFYSGNTSAEDGKMVRVYSKKQNKVIFDQFPTDTKIAKYFQYQDHNNFLSYEGIKFVKSGDNTVYNLMNDKLYPYLDVSLGEYLMPKNVFDKKFDNVMEFDNFLAKENYINVLSALYIENNKFIISVITHHANDKIYVIRDKERNKTILCNKLIDDLNFYGKITYPTDFSTIPIGIDSKSLVLSFEPEKFKEIMDNFKSSVSQEEWQQFSVDHRSVKDIYDGLTFSSNPILILAEF